MKKANDRQVAGNHYMSSIQHWDFAAWFFGAWYFRAQASRYIVRWRKKNGVQDLEKALHYLQKYTELPTPVPMVSFDEFVAANHLCKDDADILRIITLGGATITAAIDKIEALIAAEPPRKYVDQS